jgi:predicted trehalose synthase
MLTIERTDREIIIRLPLDLGVNDIQRMLDYLAYKNAIKDSQATQEQIDELAKEAKSGWWEKNKDRFKGLGDV